MKTGKILLMTALLGMVTAAVATAQPVAGSGQPSALSAQTYSFALRANLLYDAFLVPTLGMEWRINRDWGALIDGSYSFWSNSRGAAQKAFLVNPGLRRYMGAQRRSYLGLGGNYGEYNIYKYPVGNLFPDGTGYQGTLWNAGLTGGYQLYLSRRFSLDFNIGLGYAILRYDSFTVSCKQRVCKEKNNTQKFWGPTQAGVNLVWAIGG